ncbi:unnamed protein product [Staurois parvus]|uniref:Cysteine-rich DPF motif domain-containing protein 1 n=1 Tax=Staurois parvus TaxID=386267 RepID=A0ABN9GIX8_9NEOB|nr:unnamed protein product [Staurois parvus]
MDLGESHPPKGIFVCHLCGLSVPYTYFGQRPPNAHSVIFLEECYVTVDPFTPEREKVLVLGSICSLCKTSGLCWHGMQPLLLQTILSTLFYEEQK